MISAIEAQSLGIVNRVVSAEALMTEVLATAKAISQKGKVALRAAKQVIDAGLNVDLKTGCRMEVDAFALCMTSEDAKEGTTAFLEKRKAVFKGSLAG